MYLLFCTLVKITLPSYLHKVLGIHLNFTIIFSQEEKKCFTFKILKFYSAAWSFYHCHLQVKCCVDLNLGTVDETLQGK